MGSCLNLDMLTTVYTVVFIVGDEDEDVEVVAGRVVQERSGRKATKKMSKKSDTEGAPYNHVHKINPMIYKSDPQ